MCFYRVFLAEAARCFDAKTPIIFLRNMDPDPGCGGAKKDDPRDAEGEFVENPWFLWANCLR